MMVRLSKFTLAELVIVMAMLSILISLLLPSLSQARKNASLTVCLSNLNQIGKANSLFLINNNYRFIGPDDIINGAELNIGHLYVGTGGSQYKTVRPLNIYLGVTETGTKQIMKVAICPSSNEMDKIKFRNRFETSYMGSSRVKYYDDLDGAGTPLNLNQIYNPAKMVLISSNGAFHYSEYGETSTYAVDNHGERNYVFTFVDGHSSFLKMMPAEGLLGSHNRLQFRNLNK